ncbi:hypothetical protein CONLIGDRAFT_280395 [Coniochaeta ligniaria NRRL 30616]|uniref:Uncharacterized protein n=1 Tax=Coniochaeta ligniaria NRRL 30616 TaxID=1408157 RepID=A0A1J7JKX4_9PEZI|nr:hypothetical protein CONLIGDRAFT_280395 [Coniochaeta ligniaria NRRL 30616]
MTVLIIWKLRDDTIHIQHLPGYAYARHLSSWRSCVLKCSCVPRYNISPEASEYCSTVRFRVTYEFVNTKTSDLELPKGKPTEAGVSYLVFGVGPDATGRCEMRSTHICRSSSGVIVCEGCWPCICVMDSTLELPCRRLHQLALRRQEGK